MNHAPTLFEGSRMNMAESIDLTIQSLQFYGPTHNHWVVAWSGGKDSTALVTLLIYLIDSGNIAAPKKLTVLFADTRMELTPIYLSAMGIMDDLRDRGIDVRVVMAEIGKRFLPYILGRGVPPPNNGTFRWCTRQIKVEPMQLAVEAEARQAGEKILMLTGVRQGESAVRDGRIAMSCGRDGAECGQGWYQETMPEALCDTLAPILHWRVCHVWEWLRHWAPTAEFGDWDTRILADAYGGDEAEEVNARTGCVACPLASNDKALDAILKIPRWKYLMPLKELRGIYADLRNPANRLRQTGLQRLADGSIPKNPMRMGPLTIAARGLGMAKILTIQEKINTDALFFGMPKVDFLNEEEIEYIEKCWAENLFPNGWTGDEPNATEPFDQIFRDGSMQKTLFQ